MGGFLGALQFLTVVPVMGVQPALGRCVVWFPVVGALIGGLAGAAYFLGVQVSSREVAAFLAVAVMTWVGGGLHEDGLADVADALRPGRGRTVERKLAILVDSRLGTYGVLALGLVLVGRYVAVWQSGVEVVAGLVAARALGEASCVVMGYVMAPVGDGIGRWFADHLTLGRVVVCGLLGVTPLMLLDVRHAFLGLAGAVLTSVLLGRHFERHLGGVTGDCLGAAAVLVELQALLWWTVR